MRAFFPKGRVNFTLLSLRSAVFAAAMMAFAPSCFADLVLYTGIGGYGVGVNNFNLEGTDSETFFLAGQERGQDRRFTITGTTSANARAAAGSVGVDGLIELNYLSEDRFSLHFGQGGVQARASFQDSVTISAPGLDGTRGTIAFNVLVDGGFLATYPTQRQGYDTWAQWSFVLTAETDPTGIDLYGGSGVGDSTYSYDPPFSLLTNTAAVIDLPFIYGTPFTLEGVMYLDIGTTAGPGEYAFMSATFLHSADLGGIAGVRDSAGHPVTNFTITAGSGADYTQSFGSAAAVPEPETYAMLLAGLGLLGFVAHRRKQKAA